jgi:transcriptional regulator with XRE-family HTH domain
MARPNALLLAPPYPVEQGLRRLGGNLKTARLRRNLTLESVAAKIGASRRVIADAESGKPSTGAAIYVALLWAYDLLNQLDELASPERDKEGQTLSNLRDRTRAREGQGLDDDF